MRDAMTNWSFYRLCGGRFGLAQPNLAIRRTICRIDLDQHNVLASALFIVIPVENQHPRRNIHRFHV
jgi:hypothetical protein